jgi:hypothetical protein
MLQNPYLLMGRKPAGFDEMMPVDMNGVAGMQAAPQQVPLMAQAPVAPQQEAPPTQTNLNAQAGSAPPQGAEDQGTSLLQAYAEQQRLQAEAIKNAEEQLAAARSKPQQFDLTPLLSLASQWTGTDLVSGYARPQNQSKQIQALQEAVLKARGGAAEVARMRAKDVAQLEEQKAAREQRLEEISLRKGELRQAKEDRAEDRKLRLELEQNKQYYDQFGEGISGLTEVISAAKDAKNLIEEAGGNIPTDIAKFDQYKRAVSRIITGYNRDVAKLGALAGADKKLLEAAASNDPSLLEAYLKNAVGLNRGQRGVLDDLIAAGDKKMKEHEQLVKIRFKGIADPLFAAQKAIYSQERGGQEPTNLSSMTREQKIEAARIKMEGK